MSEKTVNRLEKKILGFVGGEFTNPPKSYLTPTSGPTILFQASPVRSFGLILRRIKTSLQNSFLM